MSFARPASGSQHAERSSDPVGFGLRVAAAVLLVAAGALHPARLLAEAFVTIRPFAAVGGVIGLGFVAVRLGAFGRIASLVTHERVPTWAAVLGVLVWTAALSGLVNLDVAVVVAVPLALNVAGRRGLSPALIAIMVANLVNAASFLLPTSNLTNLLILSRDPLPAAAYLRGSLPAWLAVVGVTVVAGLVLLRAPGAAAAGRAEVRWSLGGVALDLATMFVLVCALRALVPAGIALPGGFAGQVATGSLLASGIDNLPAAAAVAPVGAAGRWAAILAMSIGTNLLITGSVATVLARRIARDAGVAFDAARSMLLGVVLLPLQIVVAWGALRLAGAL